MAEPMLWVDVPLVRRAAVYSVNRGCPYAAALPSDRRLFYACGGSAPVGLAACSSHDPDRVRESRPRGERTRVRQTVRRSRPYPRSFDELAWFRQLTDDDIRKFRMTGVKLSALICEIRDTSTDEQLVEFFGFSTAPPVPLVDPLASLFVARDVFLAVGG